MTDGTASATPVRVSTRDRAIDAALALFGTRGVEVTSLDTIAGELGLTKQAILYWFPTKADLVDAVIAQGAGELAAAIEHAIARSGPGLDRLDAVMRTVFRFAVRRPQLLGLVREVTRMGPDVVGRLRGHLGPLVNRAVGFLADEMDAGTIRRGDPRLTLFFVYSTVIGVATEVDAQRALGIEPSLASLASVRRELFAYVRAALGARAT